MKSISCRAYNQCALGEVPQKRESSTAMYLTSSSLCPVTNLQLKRAMWKQSESKAKFQPYYPYCNNREHLLGTCPQVKKITTSQLKDWLVTNDKCFKCARYQPTNVCTLKEACNSCQQLHLTVLHNIALETSSYTSKVLMVHVAS